MVVTDPGDWFDETLRALAAQSYPNLRAVFFIAGGDFDQLTAAIQAAVPSAFVRPATNPNSFGSSINEVLGLIDGGNGLFLVCHDDVAPAPDAVRVLVEELFRSNAGIVGPKLVDWDDERVLQHVGLGVDRLGEIDPLIEPGEVDQEQHDAVRDVFVVPSAFMLVRADLFRSLQGFDSAISFYGEDVELCWRTHHLGERVVVVPDARVRHRERLTERRPGLNELSLKSRHRMRAVATLTGGSRLLIRSFQMVLLTVAELVVGLFTGRLGEAVGSLRALLGLIPRTGSLLSRRRAIADQRKVPESEVLGLQVRGSSRLNSFLRGRETATYVGQDTTIRRWRQVGYGPLLTWVVVIGLLLVGSRKFISESVPATGEFLPFPSAGEMMGRFRSAFDHRGLGVTSAAPTSWLFSSLFSIVTFFRMGMFRTVLVLGSVVLGAMGAWRLGSIFPATRARIATTLVYVGTPLLPWALGAGELSVLIWFAGIPWVVHQFGQTAGLRTADPDNLHPGLVDGVAPVTIDQRIKSIATASMLLALMIGFVPAASPMALFVGLTLAAATLVARGRTDVALWIAIGTLAATVGGLLLNVPWVFSWSWTDIAGVDRGATGNGLVEVASMSSGSVQFAVLALGLYAPVLVGIALTAAWRFTWSVRGLGLVVIFGAAAVMKSSGVAASWLPATGLSMVAVVLGLALSGGALISGLEVDVLTKGFGWKQPVAVLANAAMIVGLAPAALAIGSGRWGADRTPAAEMFESQFVASPDVGDYRVLYVGDPAILPVPGREFEKGIGYAVHGAGQMTFLDRSLAPGSAGDELIRDALTNIANGATARGGRLLAPLGIRYIVIPESRGVDSVVENETPLTRSLTNALARQLDIGNVPSPPTMSVFENQSFISVGADLSGPTAIASTKAGVGALVRSDFRSFKPILNGVNSDFDVVGPVEPEVVHLAIPFDDRIGLTVGGTEIPARTGFGVTTAFDVSSSGNATVTYDGGIGRTLWMLVLFVLWVIGLGVVFAPRSRLAAIRRADVADETLIDLAGGATLDDLKRYDEVVSDGERYDLDDRDIVRREPADEPMPDEADPTTLDPGLTPETERDDTRRITDVFDSDEGGWL